jgi:hypothetical protein
MTPHLRKLRTYFVSPSFRFLPPRGEGFYLYISRSKVFYPLPHPPSPRLPPSLKLWGTSRRTGKGGRGEGFHPTRGELFRRSAMNAADAEALDAVLAGGEDFEQQAARAWHDFANARHVACEVKHVAA